MRIGGRALSRYTRHMNKQHKSNTRLAEAKQALSADTQKRSAVARKYEKILLGIDWHVEHYRVVRIIENATPEPAQRFKPGDFLLWLEKQTRQAHQVYTCYEAGAGGFELHRQIMARGAINYVVHPRRLDPQGRGVVTDKTDARELALDLARYVQGNHKALAVVYAPTPEEEQRRQQTRQRSQLMSHLQSLAAQGRSLLLSQGFHEKGGWWKPKRWESLAAKLPLWLTEALQIMVQIIDSICKQLGALTRKIQAAAASKSRPQGLGALSLEVVTREACNWNRFRNRKAGSYAGLVGGVSSSGNYHCDLPLTKAGNIHLRCALIQWAWRMVWFQPQCKLIQKYKHVLRNPRAPGRARKRAIVAVARRLFIDVWRWQTGRVTPQELGWIMCEPEAALSAKA
jgi:transposase